MQDPTDKQVLDYIDSVHGLRDEWGITGSKRIGKLTFVLMNMLLIAIVVGAIAYFVLSDSKTAMKGVSGLVIVLILAYVVAGVRVFQLKSERRELPEYRKALAAALTGDPKTDSQAQVKVASTFKWESMRYIFIARMIGIAALVIIGINTYQGAGSDFARVLLFDGAILSYLAGALWANYEFKAQVLEVELEERSRATIRWQHGHPGEAQKEEDNSNDADDTSFDEESSEGH